MESLLLELLERLEQVGRMQDDLYDSECREAMRAAIHDAFLKPVDGFVIPRTFGLSMDDSNRLVREAIGRYVREASAIASDLGMTFHERLRAFQNENVSTKLEKRFYDDFFGSAPPDQFDSEGNLR